MSERRAFKDYFDAALVRELASRLSHAESSFESAKFVRSACRGLEKLEMMARVGQIAEAMNTALPLPTARKMRALIGSLPAPAKSGDGITDYGYLLWPYGEFIGRYGLDDVEASFGAMIELTQRFTSEFAVRPFLAQDPNDIFTRLEALVAHESEHVRRFISEGTRTRLPWGKRVPALEAHLGRRLKILTALRSYGFTGRILPVLAGSSSGPVKKGIIELLNTLVGDEGYFPVVTANFQLSTRRSDEKGEEEALCGEQLVESLAAYFSGCTFRWYHGEDRAYSAGFCESPDS